MNDFVKRTILNTSVILGTFVVFTVVLFWLAGNVETKAGEIVAGRTLIDERSYAMENLSNLKSRAPTAKEYGKKISALLPQQDELYSFSEYIKTAGRIHTVDVSSSFGSEPKPAGPGTPGEIDFSISLSGSMDGIKNLIDELEFKTTRYLTTIDSLSFTSAGEGIYNAEGRGKLFFQ